MRLVACLFLFIFIHFVEALREPFVVLPTAIRWRAENSITVIPREWSKIPLNIEVFITAKENILSLSEQLFYETRKISDLGSSHTFTFNSSHQPDAIEYGIKVSVTGHKDYYTVLYGVSNLKTISIQTDKGYYRPGESINVRILPINGENQLYKSDLKISLVNPQGFNVITNTVKIPEKLTRFLQAKFDIPEFSPHGFWSISVKPTNSSLPWMFSSLRIRVQDYSLPKFFIKMEINEIQAEDKIKITVIAKYFHGQPVRGSVFVVCGSQTQLLAGNLVDGSWEDKADISGCLETTTNGIIRFTATVTDVDNDKNIAIREFQPKAANFQMIPLRPLFDITTKFVRIYLKTMSTEAIGNTVEGLYQCLSHNPEYNGINASFSSQIEDTVDIPISHECVMYIIRAYRITSGTFFESDEVFLALPAVSSGGDLNLSMINPPKKVVYKVGDKFEASIPSLMNFVVICNKKDLLQSGTVSINGILTFPIVQSMQGYCILHVFGAQTNQRQTQSDMQIFFVEASTCPAKFSLKSSSDILHPPSNVTITVKAPKGSIAVVRGIDEKLYHMINTIQALKTNIYWNLNVFNEPSREENAPRLINFINTMSVYQNIRENCRYSGSHGPSNPFWDLPAPQEVSDISNYCIREFNKSSIIKTYGTMYAITDGEQKPSVSTARIFARPEAKSTKLMGKQDDIPINLNDAINLHNEIADELFLRNFFPEVWFFDDIKFSTKTEKNLTLFSPHSIGKWSFTSQFWNSGEQDVCAVEPVIIETRRHVFMEVDLPSQVYENETIQARIIVNGDNFGDEKKLAVCFTGLSPVVCGDMGKRGYMAETEYTRVVLNTTQTRSEKYIYLKFLKEGFQNVSFELREEVEVIGGDTNHCIDNKAKKFDKILKTVLVKRRLDQKEHFRQLNIYAQRKVFDTPEQGSADVARDASFLEKTNTIRFKQNLINDQEVETEVELDQDTQVIATFLEIAEYQPSFPLGVASEEITYSRRARRSTDSKNFASTLMDYAFSAYDQKQGKLNGNILDNSLRQEATLNELQRLRMELFQFSNCSIYSDSCAFGEFGPLVGGIEPSIVYTATVTSLMCEENVEDQYVCGLLYFLSNITNQGVENFNVDFHGQISFATKEEETWFLRAILRQTFLDCRMRECTKSSSVKNANNKLRESFYTFDTQKDHDIRVEAAIASVAPRILSGKFRQKIREKADTTRMPYWRVPDSLRDNDIDETVINSMDVTANSLALLAFVNQSAEVYDHYRSQFNLPRLAEWIIEEQTSDKKFQTAVDTFYAWRALYRYNERLTGPLESNNIRIQLLNAEIPMREYSNKDLPLSLQLPARSRNFTLHTIGEGRIVLGVRVLATPRKRPKRAEDNVPAIGITALQSRVSQTDNYVMQLVCIRTKSKRVETLEVEHNLYTGFSTDFSKFQLLTNTTQAGVSLIGLQRVTVGGIYFTITGISPEIPACYQLVVKEPVVSYTAEYLAPVTIDAHYNQISGQTVLYASEIKTLLQVRHKRRHLKKRSKRAGNGNSNHGLPPLGADLVDTICLDHGSCTCSELSCSAKCLTCKRKNDGGKLSKELVAQMKAPGKFGLLATHISSSSVLFGNENYTRAVMNVGFSIDRNLIFGCAPKKMGQFILWIRACNKHSCTKLIKDKLYLLVGSEKGFFEDSVSTTDESQTNSTQLILKHYLLHDGDRLEGGVNLEDDEELHSSCHQIIKDLLIARIPCK